MRCRNCRPTATAEDIQNVVYEVGRREPFLDQKKKAKDGKPGVSLDWFNMLYQVLLGQEKGPRFGSFVAVYGIQNTVDMIDGALARSRPVERSSETRLDPEVGSSALLAATGLPRRCARSSRRPASRSAGRRAPAFSDFSSTNFGGLLAQFLDHHFAAPCLHHDPVAFADRRVRRNDDDVAGAIDRFHRVAIDLKRVGVLVGHLRQRHFVPAAADRYPPSSK